MMPEIFYKGVKYNNTRLHLVPQHTHHLRRIFLAKRHFAKGSDNPRITSTFSSWWEIKRLKDSNFSSTHTKILLA